jgi:uncharacterized protein (DUF2132 family)
VPQIPEAFSRDKTLPNPYSPRLLPLVPNFSSSDPLHGVTLETILHRLVDKLGWTEMGRRIDIRCFNYDPSVKSSLQFLRRTPWARKKVEELYLQMVSTEVRPNPARENRDS